MLVTYAITQTDCCLFLDQRRPAACMSIFYTIYPCCLKHIRHKFGTRILNFSQLIEAWLNVFKKNPTIQLSSCFKKSKKQRIAGKKLNKRFVFLNRRQKCVRDGIARSLYNVFSFLHFPFSNFHTPHFQPLYPLFTSRLNWIPAWTWIWISMTKVKFKVLTSLLRLLDLPLWVCELWWPNLIDWTRISTIPTIIFYLIKWIVLHLVSSRKLHRWINFRCLNSSYSAGF